MVTTHKPIETIGVRGRSMKAERWAAEVLASFAFSYEAAQLAFHRSNAVARRLQLASIIYLPALFLLMPLDEN
jgi:heme O synthase-like polyprenyltransferase